MSETAFDPQAAAAFLIGQRHIKARNEMLPSALGVDSLQRAYDVQDAILAEMTDKGREIAGYKVGLTSPRMQEMCGLDQPVGGAVFAEVVEASPARAELSRYGRLGLEFEICVRMGAGVSGEGTPYNRDSIAGYISEVGPAFELIDDRNADYSALDIYSLIADNSWNAGVVLGPMNPFAGDPGALTGRLYLNGGQIDEGAGSDVLGHPFESVAWLANNVIERGGALKAGDLVMTGSLIPTRFPDAGETYRFAMDELGDVVLDIRT